MHLPTAELCGLLERGVYKALWQGPRGEIILLAITSRHQLLHGLHVTVPLGSDHIQAVDDLWAELDAVDPLEGDALAKHRREVLKRA